jgi:hypothetical protein
MSTKAEAFRYRTERSGPKKQKQPRPPRRDDPVDTAKPGISASDRKVGAGATAERNLSRRAERKGGAALEDSKTGRPSRKSTRKSAGRAKRDSNLARRTKRASWSPKSRASRSRKK